MSRATPPARTRELTYDQYMATPITRRRQEVVDGVIVMSPSPTNRHQKILGRLFRAIDEHVERNGLGSVLMAPADVVIRKEPKLRIRQPDLLFIAAGRMSPAEVDEQPNLQVAPDLAVEIRSPGESPARWREKLADYAALGVPEVWRVDPEARTVEVLSLAGEAYERLGLHSEGASIGSPALPGLDLPVAGLFG